MLRAGKLDSDLLEKIVFDKLKFKRDEVLTRPGIGEDCAVVDYGEYECVLSTDPITAAAENIGRLAVHISCNDIASNGVEPIGLLLAVMLPVGTTEDEIEEMMRQAGEASEELGVEIIGGHTEITGAVNQPVIVSTAIGRALKGNSESAGDMKPGDKILLTKAAGLEGTGVIAGDNDLSDILTPREKEEALAMLDEVSVVTEGVIAGRIGTHGMHDVTEGGVLGAVWEMCHISGLGAAIDKESIKVREVTAKVCAKYDIDPLRLISSGCMMICCAAEKEEEISSAIKSAGIEVSSIGRVTEPGEGIRFTGGEEIDPPMPDEIYKAVG